MYRVVLIAVVAILSQSVAQAGVTFVGSWQVDEGPTWFSAPPDGPLAYTGQEAAAFLFGGNATDYAISTIGADPNNVNHMAWYSVIGHTSVLLPEDYFSKYLGQFYGPTDSYPISDPTAAASAYINDNAQGDSFVNYAFRVTNDAVPEPTSIMLLGLGGIGAGLAAWRRRRLAVA